MKDLRRMAFQLEIRNNVPHPFSVDKKSAGRKWLRLFFKRHPTLTVRSLQSLLLAPAQGFNRESVDKFYSILKPELENIQFNAMKVYNVDTGITVVQHKAQKGVAVKVKSPLKSYP